MYNYENKNFRNDDNLAADVNSDVKKLAEMLLDHVLSVPENYQNDLLKFLKEKVMEKRQNDLKSIECQIAELKSKGDMLYKTYEELKG
jgi:hypothetical protein